MKQPEYRIGYLDIETAPNVGYTWGLYEQNVLAFTRQWYILSFSILWEGEKKPMTFALPHYELYLKDRHNDRELVKDLWNILDQADLIVAHNGDRFDLRKANARFLVHGLTPPSPYKTVDTLKIARKHFAMNSNKLNDVAMLLNVGKKAETGGFQLWLDCMDGVPAAWKKMAKYNSQDVLLLREVYNKLRAWHISHPNINLKDEDFLTRCPACGSEHVQKRGFTYLATYKAQRYVCTACGKWSRGGRTKINGNQLT